MLISTKTASPDAILVDCYYQYALAQISIAADAYYYFLLNAVAVFEYPAKKLFKKLF